MPHLTVMSRFCKEQETVSPLQLAAFVSSYALGLPPSAHELRALLLHVQAASSTGAPHDASETLHVAPGIAIDEVLHVLRLAQAGISRLIPAAAPSACAKQDEGRAAAAQTRCGSCLLFASPVLRTHRGCVQLPASKPAMFCATNWPTNTWYGR